MNLKITTIKQVDKQLKKWSAVKAFHLPKNSWIKTIRKALCMTTQQLAKKLNVDRSRITRIESDESKSVLTMKTLVTVANALDCEFVYALVPRKSLYRTIKQQIDKVAIQQLKQVSYNMALENQKLSPESNEKQLTELKKKLWENIPRNLWNSDE